MNTQEILASYPDLAAFMADEPVWKSVGIRDRMALVKQFNNRAKMGYVHTPIVIHQPTSLANEVELDTAILEDELSEEPETKETFSLNITLDEAQAQAVELAKEAIKPAHLRKINGFNLSGKAGTGKTTTLREVFKALIASGWAPEQIGAGAFTRVATGNIRKAVEKDEALGMQISHRIQTIHSHLEFKPFWWDDLATGKTKMEFRPTRTAEAPLDIMLFVSEESSMWGLDLWQKWYDAMRAGTFMIFVGDLNQLPPVFGKSIFNYALNQLPTVELTTVHRQAQDSGVLQNAYRVLDGMIPITNKDCEVISGNPKMKTGQAKLSIGLGQTNGFFHKLSQVKGIQGYDPEQDIILSPWNKQALGTINMNNWIAQFLGDQRGAVVYHIIAGYRQLYLAVGDQVFIDKKKGWIEEIVVNGDYKGKMPAPSSKDLLRFGSYRVATGGKAVDFDEEEALSLTGYEDINVDEVADDEKRNAASHIIKVRMEDDTDETPLTELRSAGDYSDSSFSLGYCLTVHKAQGCEWRKVFIILHEDHAARGNFISRELLYTAITRAREKLVIIAKDAVLERGVKNQIIKGKTIEEKIAFINAAGHNMDQYPVIKAGEDNRPFRNLPSQQFKEKETVAIQPSSQPKHQPFRDFSKYLPESLKDEINSRLFKIWDSAMQVWGKDIGSYPTISYDIPRLKTLGLAMLGKHHIKLNPIHLIYGLKNPECMREMLEVTLPHELAHLVAYKYSGDKAHDTGWIMAMKLLSQDPQATYKGNDVPAHWTKGLEKERQNESLR